MKSILAKAAGIALALSVTTLAWADDPTTELRREVSDLRREIADLRREIYALRLDLLTAIDQIPGRKIGSAAVPAKAAPEPPVVPEVVEVDDKKAAVRVTGAVDLGGGSGPAYVYVDNVTPQLAKGASFDLKQSGRQFSPRHAVVQVGTKVNFPNLDSMYHNVFSKTPGSVFDLGIYRAGDPIRSYTMTKPGVVDVFCDMHSEMSARLLVVPSKLYVAVGADGKFALDNVPRGNRKIVAWAPGFEPSSQTIAVGGKESALSFKLTPKSSAHTNKNEQPYGSYK